MWYKSQKKKKSINMRTSNCCDARPVEDLIDRDKIGRCSKCKEMAEFLSDEEYELVQNR